jgi:nucleoside 2-deoxyribosyltransferase
MLTGDGMIKAEEWRQTETKSAQGFVAMWFDMSLTDAWQNGFSKAIEAAGYTPIRIDNVEHANKICDEIIVEIRRSRFVVADFTGQRNGVYYEAGFARALNLPVIWTCQKDDLANLHFDIRQYNCIDWEAPEDLRARLQNRLIALLGEGPRIQH